MGNHIKRIAAVASGLLLMAGLSGGSAVAADAKDDGNKVAAACFDVVHSYIKPAGKKYFPYDGSHLVTTSRCADINIMPKVSGYIAVCFKPSTGNQYCNGWTWAAANRWAVVASDVRNGTRFYFTFNSSARSTGGWAA
ncbi:hypothetical protein [Streptomyces cucumeris]|uniref:hypothetical protein n=1 Tax=Streptomyces cucumeris TaxID=2962890 RepID=UPI0020C93204|nr:hypothetical protein [Streptomyces sp. NEAU-Y11]MCP9213213.1 hypothetical protein [Streptomyces sp. NEAU-Y11]